MTESSTNRYAEHVIALERGNDPLSGTVYEVNIPAGGKIIAAVINVIFERRLRPMLVYTIQVL